MLKWCLFRPDGSTHLYVSRLYLQWLWEMTMLTIMVMMMKNIDSLSTSAGRKGRTISRRWWHTLFVNSNQRPTLILLGSNSRILQHSLCRAFSSAGKKIKFIEDDEPRGDTPYICLCNMYVYIMPCIYIYIYIYNIRYRGYRRSSRFSEQTRSGSLSL